MHSSAISNGTHVRLPDWLLLAIERSRRNEPDIPTRPEMIRRLLQQAVTARADVNDGYDRTAA
jgi:hypothetical protein